MTTDAFKFVWRSPLFPYPSMATLAASAGREAPDSSKHEGNVVDKTRSHANHVGKEKHDSAVHPPRKRRGELISLGTDRIRRRLVSKLHDHASEAIREADQNFRGARNILEWLKKIGEGFSAQYDLLLHLGNASEIPRLEEISHELLRLHYRVVGVLCQGTDPAHGRSDPFTWPLPSSNDNGARNVDIDTFERSLETLEPRVAAAGTVQRIEFEERFKTAGRIMQDTAHRLEKPEFTSHGSEKRS